MRKRARKRKESPCQALHASPSEGLETIPGKPPLTEEDVRRIAREVSREELGRILRYVQSIY